uniref:uncharacterized protein LOC114670815 n=1 Tax=Macaca mulatta TaxID=9544 RepID=UPI0010A27C72|nr:uncharacterized protein LOC114670815 [Macaca mulatta]XP_028685187.1 uncharacterized protein LOC114670815 [Macaca mulatta]
MFHSGRPSSSLRPRRSLSREPPRHERIGARDGSGQESRRRARPEPPSVAAQPCVRAWEARQGPSRSCGHPAKSAARAPREAAAAAASPAGFLFLSEVFSPTPLLLLLLPSPLPTPCPLPALRLAGAVTPPGGSLKWQSPLGPLGGIFGPGAGAHWARGRRGARERWGGGQSGSGGRGRSWAGAGRPSGGRATRETAAAAPGR